LATDNGKQQISIHYNKDVRSIYVNQILYNLYKPGVYNSRIKLEVVDNANIRVIIKKGTTVVFKSTFTDVDLGDSTPKEFLVKIHFGEDAEITVPIASRDLVPSVDPPKLLAVKLTWSYSTDVNQRYAVPDISLVEDGISDDELYLCLLLNAEAAADAYNAEPTTKTAAWLSQIEISYKGLENYHFMSSLFDSNSNFKIFHNYQNNVILVTQGEALINSTYCKVTWEDWFTGGSDTIFAGLLDKTDAEFASELTNDEGFGWVTIPEKLSTVVGADSQVDILSLVPPLADAVDTRPTLQWTSFRVSGSVTYPSDSDYYDIDYNDQSLLLNFIKNMRLPLETSGKILLIGIRNYARVNADDSTLLPKESIVFTNFKEQIGKSLFDSYLMLPIR
jgi:hypothetical protein